MRYYRLTARKTDSTPVDVVSKVPMARGTWAPPGPYCAHSENGSELLDTPLGALPQPLSRLEVVVPKTVEVKMRREETTTTTWGIILSMVLRGRVFERKLGVCIYTPAYVLFILLLEHPPTLGKSWRWHFFLKFPRCLEYFSGVLRRVAGDEQNAKIQAGSSIASTGNFR